MCFAVALEDEEKFDRRHKTGFIPSLIKTILNSWVKRTVLIAITFFLTFYVNTTSAGHSLRRWWNNNWNYRINLTVDVDSYERTEKPVEQYLNLTALLRRIGRSGTVIEESLRVVEVNSDGDVVDDRVPFQYDAMTDTWSNLVFVLTGKTSAGTRRYYDVYFDTAGTFELVAVGPQVQLTDDVMDEGQASYRIVTQNATYFYQKEAGGFSSLLDIDGNDWINFHPWGGSDGIYRGIPNMVHPDNIFHPGHKNCSSSILHTGPLKVTIHTVSNNGLWECTWEIYPYYARMTLLKKADKNYWFLYEGTPGGKLDLTTDFSVRSNGIRLPVEQSWREKDIPAPEWVYFEDSVLDRYIYLIHEEDDLLSDDFWQMQSNMTVFGFGRTQNVNDKQLSGVPMHFTFGLADDATFSSANKVIEGSYRPVSITISDAVALADFSENGTVDSGDLVILSNHWLIRGESRCDMNQDNAVDLKDFAQFSNYWKPDPKPPELLQGYWMFDEGTGTTAADSSGFGNHGTIVGATWTAAGKYGSALEFDGNDDYVEIKGYKGVIGTQSRTLTAWVKTQVNRQMDIISWGNKSSGEQWLFSTTGVGSRSEPTGVLRLNVSSGYITGSERVTDDQWHHIAAVLENDVMADVSDVMFYVDGEPDILTKVVPQAIHTTMGTNVRIGASSKGTDRFFEGYIDSVCVYERAVSGTEIRDMSRGTHVDADDSGSRIGLEQGHGELSLSENSTCISVERGKEQRSAITRHVSPRQSAVRSTGGLHCQVKIPSFRNEPMDLRH